jgi:hypothetical protein
MKKLIHKGQSPNDKFWVHRADLQRATIVKSLAGATKKEWQPIERGIQCYIRALSGDELVAAEKAGVKSDYRMYCSKDLPVELGSVEHSSVELSSELSSVQCGDRIVSDGKGYEITFVNSQIGAHLQIDLKRIQ